VGLRRDAASVLRVAVAIKGIRQESRTSSSVGAMGVACEMSSSVEEGAAGAPAAVLRRSGAGADA
jgi:hypothetical protein